MTVPVRIPDLDYWKSQIKCQAACPVHTDARGYVRAIAEGDLELAYLIARGPNPLASICGRICGAPCELACRRGELDRPIAIRALKRFVCERYGPEAHPDVSRGLIDFLKDSARRAAQRRPDAQPCTGAEELLPLLQSLLAGDVPLATGKSVGIIGSGPAGLAAAHDLTLLGIDVTIYEMEPVLAGMLSIGVPEYRLPRDLIRAEVAVIEALGVRAVTSCEVGKDISLAQLRQRHDAVIVAVGAKRSRRVPIPGAGAAEVLGGVEFLRDIALGRQVPLGRRVVVIGGGNVAYDVGRTVLRQISLDAARTALREAGVSTVTLCSLESLAEMPADDVEILEGDEEGIVRRNGLGPVELEQDAQGRVTGVVFRPCTRVYDERHRFAPLFDDSVRETIPCDTVLLAIGQEVDLRFVDAQRDAVELTPRGTIACDPVTGATRTPGLYVAGDLAYGPKLLIHAVASGKQVAREIYRAVTGRTLAPRDVELHLALPGYLREASYETTRRVAVPTATPKARLASQSSPVEMVYTHAQAHREASRCLDCGVNTIFDGDKCILCGGCVDVCPQLCLRIVSVDRLVPAANGAADGAAVGGPAASAVPTPAASAASIAAASAAGTAKDSAAGSASHGRDRLSDVLATQLAGVPPGQASAIVKDETICIRCALCAQRCPTGAITMERFLFQERLVCQVA
jgi:formate dehydrogenase beta subunit